MFLLLLFDFFVWRIAVKISLLRSVSAVSSLSRAGRRHPLQQPVSPSSYIDMPPEVPYYRLGKKLDDIKKECANKVEEALKQNQFISENTYYLS
jgi:hypothetical protein